MSEIYSKYLSLNESKSDEKSPSKKSVRKSLKEDRWEGYEEAKEVFYDAEVGEVWIGNVIEGDDAFTMYLEGDSEEDIEKAIDNVCNHYEKNAEKYPLVLSVDGDVEAGTITFFIEVGDEDLEESKKKVSLKNKKKLSEKSKKKAIKEWRRNISGYSEISDEEVKKYQSELDEIGDKLEKSGISVKKVGQVNVEEFEGSDDYFTEEAWGYIELSKPIKDEDDFEKICDIVEPYIDNRLSDVKDIGSVGSNQLYITFKVVDRFWDEEELEESKKLAKKVKNVVENKKRKSFKEFKKLKESRKKLSKRKLNESDSVSIEIDFGNYQECLRCIFKVEGENLGTDQLDWYTEVGMEMGIDPNSMYVWVKNDVELLSLEEVREYKDLGDASDEEVIEFANERGYYEGEINGDIYFLVPLGM